jgi:hypothetical protein
MLDKAAKWCTILAVPLIIFFGYEQIYPQSNLTNKFTSHWAVVLVCATVIIAATLHYLAALESRKRTQLAVRNPMPTGAELTSQSPASTEASNDDPRIYLELVEPKFAIMSRTPFILWNRGKDVAHKIQIKPFKLKRNAVTFPVVEAIAAGDKGETLPTIDSDTNEHDIFYWLEKDWDAFGVSGGVIATEWPIEIEIGYSDFTLKKKFVTTMTFVFFAVKYTLEKPPVWPMNDKVLWEFRDIVTKRIS